MNKPESWRLILMFLAIAFGLIFTIPNFYGEAPAIQVSPGKSLIKINSEMTSELEKKMNANGIKFNQTNFSETIGGNTLKIRFSSTEEQLRAKSFLEEELNSKEENYVVALNLISNVPNWLANINAFPMYLGLDLRGGVHFLLEVDQQSAISTKLDSIANESRSTLRKKRIRYTNFKLEKETISITFKTKEAKEKAIKILSENIVDIDWISNDTDQKNIGITGQLPETAKTAIKEFALKQNIVTLSNRINELGVAEPIVQQQGSGRIVVQLPGVQDTAKAKEILGRTASLEVRLVDDTPDTIGKISKNTIPPNIDILKNRDGDSLALLKEILITGQNLTDAQAGFDSQNPLEPAVHLTLDAKGTRIFREITRQNVGKRLAILLVEKGKGEVITAPVIRSEIPGGRVQISGSMTTTEAADIALLLRAGSLAAPMDIIEERLIGPSLGADNIEQGFNSTLWGFVAIAVFIILYYAIFGTVSALSLSLNLTLLVSLLSLLQATLTLPGIAAMALTLGMAIDSNVLINERIREEIRNGATPNLAISIGYEKAWATILDSNVTTLIAGLALLVFGSGPIRGFAVVHVLGILTSMFSSVLFSRGLVNIIYGRKKKINKLAIG